MECYSTFGIMVTLVRKYIEIFNLLGQVRSQRACILKHGTWPARCRDSGDGVGFLKSRCVCGWHELQAHRLHSEAPYDWMVRLYMGQE